MFERFKKYVAQANAKAAQRRQEMIDHYHATNLSRIERVMKDPIYSRHEEKYYTFTNIERIAKVEAFYPGDPEFGVDGNLEANPVFCVYSAVEAGENYQTNPTMYILVCSTVSCEGLQYEMSELFPDINIMVNDNINYIMKHLKIQMQFTGKHNIEVSDKAPDLVKKLLGV